jgi:hypothetical protein
VRRQFQFPPPLEIAQFIFRQLANALHQHGRSMNAIGLRPPASIHKRLVDPWTKSYINGFKSFWSFGKPILHNDRACLNITFPMYLIEIEYRFNHHKDNLFKLFLRCFFVVGGTLIQRQLLLREDWGESKVPRSMTWPSLSTMDPVPSRGI